MADVFTSAKRSHVMSRIRSRGNADTEMRMVSLLRTYRLAGWRRGILLQGKPDFVWHRERVALFVDGCFWHGCPRHGRTPGTRVEYWRPKLARNARRDRSVTRTLRKNSWTVVRVWECGLQQSGERRVAARIARALRRPIA